MLPARNCWTTQLVVFPHSLWLLKLRSCRKGQASSELLSLEPILVHWSEHHLHTRINLSRVLSYTRHWSIPTLKLMTSAIHLLTRKWKINQLQPCHFRFTIDQSSWSDQRQLQSTCILVSQGLSLSRWPKKVFQSPDLRHLLVSFLTLNCHRLKNGTWNQCQELPSPKPDFKLMLKSKKSKQD